MSSFSLMIRYGTFAAAVAGIVSMTMVLKTLHAQTPQGVAPPPVAPARKPFPVGVAGTGIIEALRENVAIGVPEAGLVTEVLVKVGDEVKKDQPLLHLDDRLLKAQLIGLRADAEVAKANIGVSTATRHKAADALARLESVNDPRAISQDDLRNRRNDLTVAEAQLDAARAAAAAAEAKIQQTESLIERLIVKAPREGTVLQVNIRAGEFAAISPKQPVIVLGDLRELQIRADIDEQNAPKIKKGQKAVAWLKGDNTTVLDLTFARIEPYMIPKVSLTGASTERVDTRVLQVIYTLPRPAGMNLYAGQQVDVFIGDPDAKPAAPPATAAP